MLLLHAPRNRKLIHPTPLTFSDGMEKDTNEASHESEQTSREHSDILPGDAWNYPASTTALGEEHTGLDKLRERLQVC